MENNSEHKKIIAIRIIIVAVIVLLIAGGAVYFIVRHNSNEKHKASLTAEEGMYGTWVADYSDCVVTIEQGFVVTEFYGETKYVATCELDEPENGVFVLTPVEGEFFFADYYIYEEVSGKKYLTSYIYLDNQQLVKEEYISFYKSKDQ